MIETLLADLATGLFASRASDPRSAARLIEGTVRLGESEIDVFDPATFDDPEALPRVHFLALHSLRWIDPLRRAGGEDAAQAWTRIVGVWSRSQIARNSSSDAWRSLPLEQRATALALGGSSGADLTDLLTQHRNALQGLAGEQMTSSRRLQLLKLELVLHLRTGASAEQTLDVAIQAVTRAFTEDGYTIARDLGDIPAVAKQWQDLLDAIGLDHNHEAVDRLRATGFWRHALAPEGRLVPIGGAVPETFPGIDEPRTRYVLTHGEEGAPPAELSRIDPTGLVSLRSGWGETERDPQDETLATVLLGPVRDRDAHEDPGRVTYHSQGRSWLIDPPDVAASGSDSHSIVYISSAPYRSNGEVSLARHYSDGQTNGLLIKSTVHRLVQWQRHVVFARTGNYLVVEDTARSTSDFEGFQQWIVAPDVQIEPANGTFFLHAEGRTVALYFSALGARDAAVDEITDAEGQRIARRIRVPLTGHSARAISVVCDVTDRETFTVRRNPSREKEFTISIRDKHLDELLVVTPEMSAVMPADLEPEEAVRRTMEFSAAGDLSAEEALAQRIDARRAIERAKAHAASGPGGQEQRREAIEELIAEGDRLKIRSLRDHGFAAALVDLAGTDLNHHVASHPQVQKHRRTALVQHPGVELIQPSYSIPVRTTADSDTVPEGVAEPYVWSVDHGQLVASAYLHDAPGEVLTVYFHGATDRTRFSMPRFERLRSFSQLGTGPVMLFSDPCLDLDSRMILSWYVGTEELDLHHEIARMITAYARSRGLSKVMLVGNSGGGFASLQLGAYLDGARVISFNPQIQVDRYVPRIAETAHWALFGRTTVSDDPVQAPRMDLIERYTRIGFDQDVLLIQNPGDNDHYQEHFLPFTAAFEASDQACRLRTLTPYLGPGHRVPPPQDYMQIVKDEIAVSRDSEWELRGLRGQ